LWKESHIPFEFTIFLYNTSIGGFYSKVDEKVIAKYWRCRQGRDFIENQKNIGGRIVRCSVETCTKIHEALVGKKRPFDLTKMTEQLINYLCTIMSISECLMKNTDLEREKEYYIELLAQRKEIKKMADELAWLLKEQIVELNSTIQRCREEELRQAEEKEKIEREETEALKKGLSTFQQD
jgi:hypothetical protein